MMKIDRKLKQTTCLTTIKKIQVQRDNVSEMFGGCCQHPNTSLRAPADTPIRKRLDMNFKQPDLMSA